MILQGIYDPTLCKRQANFKKLSAEDATAGDSFLKHTLVWGGGVVIDIWPNNTGNTYYRCAHAGRSPMKPKTIPSQREDTGICVYPARPNHFTCASKTENSTLPEGHNARGTTLWRLSKNICLSEGFLEAVRASL